MADSSLYASDDEEELLLKDKIFLTLFVHSDPNLLIVMAHTYAHVLQRDSNLLLNILMSAVLIIVSINCSSLELWL